MRPRTRPRRTDAIARCLVALGFVTLFIVAGIAATSATATSVMAVKACCAAAIGVVAILELRPAVVVLSGAPQRAAIACLRRQLDALPETPHPLDA